MPTVNDPNGTPQFINSENRAMTQATVEIESLHVNIDDKGAYSVLVDVTTASTDDDFFYLKNKDDNPLIIYEIEGWCNDANQEIKILIGATDAGTDAGDALTPVNRNAGAGDQPADVDCTQDATDLAITGGRVCDLLKFPTTALEREEFNFLSGIIVPKNQRLHMEAALDGLINLTIRFYFRPISHSE